MVAFVYIVSGESDTLHVDFTMGLMRAMWLHKTGVDFMGRPALTYEKLLYYERCNKIRDAHLRKNELSQAPVEVLEEMVLKRNPARDDLSARWFPIAPQNVDAPPTAIVELPSDPLAVG